MSRPRRCLVLHPGAVGDVLLALPALAHLATVDPSVYRVIAVTPRLATLLRDSAYAEATIEFDRLGLEGLFVDEADPRAETVLAGYDIIVSWFGAGDPTYRAHLQRLGASAGRRVVIARAAPAPGSGVHASRHLLESLAPLGPVPAGVPSVRLTVGDAERRWVTSWLVEHGLAPKEAVVVHPGAGRPAKVWPWYDVLAQRLEVEGLPVVAVTGPAETGGHRWPVAVVARDLSLRRLAALFEVARAFVGNDSGLTHLAAAVGCPTLALFGPTDLTVWAPLGPHVRGLAGGAPGSADPWRGLTVERVEAAFAELSHPVSVPDGPARPRQPA